MFDSRYADRLIDALHDYLNAVDRNDGDEMLELAKLLEQELANGYIGDLVDNLVRHDDDIFEPKRKTLEEEAAYLAGLCITPKAGGGTERIGTQKQWMHYENRLKELKEKLK